LTIFTCECALKIIAYGFLFHPNAYLRNIWNFLDFSIVLIGIISTANDLMADSSNADQEKEVSLDLKSLRAARIIRPLKLVNGVPSKLSFINENIYFS
jgi:hypothetical protein